jgi:hypothetical protein
MRTILVGCGAPANRIVRVKTAIDAFPSFTSAYGPGTRAKKVRQDAPQIAVCARIAGGRAGSPLHSFFVASDNQITLTF